MTSVLVGTAVTQEIPRFEDTVDFSVIPVNNDKCGLKTFNILDPPQFITLADSTISLQTDDAQFIGFHLITVQITMADYPSITSNESFTVEIKACIPSLSEPLTPI